jgi:putative ABC transport system ATP-binding protein
MIDIRNAALAFGHGTPNFAPVLRGLSLQLAQGEFVTVIGSNGAGKSTLLNTLAGDLKLDEGTLRIDGTDVTDVAAHQRARLVARVFQDPMAGTCSDLSIEENMALALRRSQGRSFRAASGARERRGFRDRLSSLGLGLENRLGDRIGLLSGGQRQAISLLMSVLAPSRVLLLDEHTAALDPKASAMILDLTQRFVREFDLTTLMITHSMRDALAYGDRIVMLHEGRVIFDARGQAKRALTVADLLERFASLGDARQLDDDRLLLA